MKRCPKCGQQYGDPDLNFCLNDGELLMQLVDSSFGKGSPSPFADDAPPTVMMNDPRATNPTGWPGPSSHGQLQNQSPVYQSPQAAYSAPFPTYSSPDQTLSIVSLCLGAASITVGWCCSTGLLLGPAAIIMGIIALMQNKKNPEKYGGKGLAIGGIVTGGLFLVFYILFIIIYGLAVIGGALPR